ncbi:MAG: KEOPS complex subunit Cgi121 [Thaumarchaeota archaeon]|nr:KEOPS complex subunit Cgi121 [Candidatus Calditenuaceae archaeon]MDW8186586.1 KEOPS complex subunit Cgi121 [Nitrososphaerota archaeon]
MISETYGGYRMVACGIRSGVEDPVGALSNLSLPAVFSVQLYDPGAASSERQISLAFILAIDSFLTGTNRAKRVEVEVLRYLACSTQIEQALRRAGVRERMTEVGVLVVAEGGANPEEGLGAVARALRGELAPDLTFKARSVELLARYGIDTRRLACIPKSEGVDREELLLLEEMVTLRI